MSLATLEPSTACYSSDWNDHDDIPVAHIAATPTRGLCGSPISRTPDIGEEFAKCDDCFALWVRLHPEWRRHRHTQGVPIRS
jgi:hypothetical protein